jgi:hypothetical protein
MLSNTTLSVQILGLSLIPPSLVTSAVTSALSPVAVPVDNVLGTLLRALGIRAGGTEVRVHGLVCRGSVAVM